MPRSANPQTATIRRALPGPLLASTPFLVCLWLLAKNKNADAKHGFRDLSILLPTPIRFLNAT